MARPRKLDYQKLIDDADAYIASADPPILAEYAHLHGITRCYLYQLAESEKNAGRPELSNTIKKISEAKEFVLEKNALNGKYNSTMAVFSLKQLGWRDRMEYTDTSALDKLDQILEETKKNANTESETE